jgi:hypothetical protein
MEKELYATGFEQAQDRTGTVNDWYAETAVGVRLDITLMTFEVCDSNCDVLLAGSASSPSLSSLAGVTLRMGTLKRQRSSWRSGVT